MSVLECCRNNCSNVMCDAMIDGSYVCNSCVEEFKKLVGDEAKPRHELLQAFREFKMTPKREAWLDDIVSPDDLIRYPDSERDDSSGFPSCRHS